MASKTPWSHTVTNAVRVQMARHDRVKRNRDIKTNHKVIGQQITGLRHQGFPQHQAVAIAYRKAGRATARPRHDAPAKHYNFKRVHGKLRAYNKADNSPAWPIKHSSGSRKRMQKPLGGKHPMVGKQHKKEYR